MTTQHANMPDRPWDDLERPTSQQLLDWLDAFQPEHDQQYRLTMVAQLLDAQDRAARCFMADHDSYPRQIAGLQGSLRYALERVANLEGRLDAVIAGHLTPTEGRYRLAWQSARRRARAGRIKAYTEGWGSAVAEFNRQLGRLGVTDSQEA